MEKSETEDSDLKAIQESCSLYPQRSSPEKHSKRKFNDNPVREKTLKKSRTAESYMNSMKKELSDNASKLRKIKKKETRSSVNTNPLDSADQKIILKGMNGEIDDILEETAQNKRLTVTNVKHILRHVITNEHVLAMVQNTMKTDNDECDNLEEAMFEPKLTRSKVKELQEKQHILPWVISTAVKQSEPASRALLEEEFSDGSSSDEDYKPNEEEFHSEEENIMLSPKSADLNSSFCDKTLSPVKKILEEDADEDALVIALPESEPDPETAAGDTEADKIALRTRSKLPLNDIPLEEIEASFVAPDITADMYDTHCDDKEWQTFLQELSKPIDAIVAVEKPDEEPDDVEDDPEYNFLDDEDIPDELDLRFDNTVKITRKEVDALMAEIMESAEMELNDYDEEDEDLDTSARPESPSFTKRNDEIIIESVRTEWIMTEEEKLQLDQQMRMYVQLLTQSYLLSLNDPDLEYINISSKLFLNEIKMYASRGISANEISAFHAYNLDGALGIVNRYESGKINVKPNLKSKNHKTCIKSVHIKKTLFNSNVFIYPELLPESGYYRYPENKKAKFTSAEDNLISLGLEEFSFTSAPVYYINSLLLPTKSEYQIKLRIKNSKCEKIGLDNPIKYYFKYKCAPPFTRIIRTFNPNDVKAPKDYHPDFLPNWMKSMCNPASILTSLRILPLVSKTFIPYVPHIKKSKINVTYTYRKILPKSPPLTQISPILKKCNQKRHILPKNLIKKNSTLSTEKIVQFPERLVVESPTLKPVSNSEDTDEENIPLSLLVTNYVNAMNHSKSKPTEKDTSDAVTEVQNAENSSSIKLYVNHQPSASEYISDLGVSQCDDPVETEVADKEDEETVDDEPECTAQGIPTVLSSTSPKKIQCTSKRKTELQQDLKSSLALLEPDLTENRTELYFEIKLILKDYPAFVEDFRACLCPDQPKVCTKYAEYDILSKITQFVRKVEILFRNQPHHLSKILKIFSQFKQQPDITSAEVLATLQPLLGNQSHLMEELASILPDIAPPEKFQH